MQTFQVVHEGGGLRPGAALSARGASGFRVWRVQKPGRAQAVRGLQVQGEQ